MYLFACLLPVPPAFVHSSWLRLAPPAPSVACQYTTVSFSHVMAIIIIPFVSKTITIRLSASLDFIFNQSSRKDAERMYETGTESCPVASFKKYVSKLNPECVSFFQTLKTVAPDFGPWYKQNPVGRNIHLATSRLCFPTGKFSEIV